MTNTPLSAILVDYLVLRPISEGAAYQLRRTIRLFGEHLGHPPALDDLTDMDVSRWLQGLEGSHAGWTRSGHRTRLLTLWRFAAKRKLCNPPGEVRRETPPEPQPESWTVQQVAALVSACLLIIEGWYLRPLILAAYETGLRKSDLQGLRRDQIGSDGVIRMRQHKTGWPHEPRMSPTTLTAVLALPGDFPLACPWGCRRYTSAWRRLRELAGLGDHGACQQLRRTGATWVAVDNGMDAARQFLGHKSSEMVKHYVDRSRLAAKQPLPPRVA
jgi:integrase